MRLGSRIQRCVNDLAATGLQTLLTKISLDVVREFFDDPCLSKKLSPTAYSRRIGNHSSFQDR